MANKNIKTRVSNKYDMASNWDRATFIPMRGELIIYAKEDIDANGEIYERFAQEQIKIGDGIHTVSELPFIDTSTELQMRVTWEELVGLRNNGKLIPGMNYRIIDYQCTTTQENTYAMDHRFDIIVQALSTNILSESAKADYHVDENGNADGYFGSNSMDIPMRFHIFIDETGEAGEPIAYERRDKFVEYGYLENIDGDVVPVLYKTDIVVYPTETDYQDIFYYVGNYELDGVTYDRWRKIDSEYPWESINKIYVLTDVIVANNKFIGSVNSGGITSDVKMAAWEIKYCLDNDITRFSWADPESGNGRGVIYYMKDEWDNECPYDFKNIQYCDELLGYCYTFNYYDTQAQEHHDLSLNRFYHNDNDNLTDYEIGCHGNIIKPYYDQTNNSNKGYGRKQKLNFIYFKNYADGELGPGKTHCCYSNLCNFGCRNITFGKCCSLNTIGNDCRDIVFNDNCNYNSLGKNNVGHVIKAGAAHNTFGDNCFYIDIGHTNSHITIGNECSYIDIYNRTASSTLIASYIRGNSTNKLIINNTKAYNLVYEAPNTTHFILG